jgi:hypothetical protein
MSKEEYIIFLEAYIDSKALAEMENLGILKKKGSSTWYYVLKPADVPRHIACIPSQRQLIKKGDKETILWKFPTATEVKRSQSLLTKLRNK